MKYKIISLLSLEDAFMQSDNRLNTLQDIVFSGDSISDSLVSSSKYSVEYAITHKGEFAILKILIEPDSSRGNDIMNSIYSMNMDNLSFFVKTVVVKNELIVADGWSDRLISDAILIYDSFPTMVDYIKCADELPKSVLTDFLVFFKELLLRGLVFDLVSLSAIKYSTERGVVISPVVNFIYRKRNSTSEILAFRSYLLLKFLQISICYLNHCRECDYWEEEEIEIGDLEENFDLRKIEYYCSCEFISYVEEIILKLKNKSEYDYTLCNAILKSCSVADSVAIIDDMIKKLVVLEYKPLETPFIDENKYEIVGNHVENRISVRRKSDNKIGYINFAGDFVIDFFFDTASDFSEEFAVCSIDGLYGLINREGEIVVAFEYSQLEWDATLNTLFWAKGKDIGQYKRSELRG